MNGAPLSLLCIARAVNPMRVCVQYARRLGCLLCDSAIFFQNNPLSPDPRGLCSKTALPKTYTRRVLSFTSCNVLRDATN